MKICLAVVQNKGEVLFCYIAALLKSMKDMQKHLKWILIRMFSNWFYFFPANMEKLIK